MPSTPLTSILSSLLALAAVLGLIILAARLLRASGIAPQHGGRIGVLASLAIDSQRRLVLIRADQRQFLILTGAGAHLVVSEIQPAP